MRAARSRLLKPVSFDRSCGHSQKKDVYPRSSAAHSKYIQGPNELAKLASYVEPLGKKALVINASSGVKRVGDKVAGSFEGVSAEQLPDERKETACAFMGRAIAFYEGLGVAAERVMTDNGSAWRSGEFNALLEARGMGHK